MPSNRRPLLRKHDYLSLLLTSVGTGAATVLAVASFDVVELWHGVVGGIAVLTAVGGQGWVTIHSNRTRTAAEREKLRELATPVIEQLLHGTVKAMTTRPEAAAAVVYFPDGTNTLRPAFSFNKKEPLNDLLTWREWVGCTGHAWGTKTQAWADLSRTTKEDLAERWKLSENAIKLTAGIQAVVSTPIWSIEQRDTLLGIVSIDSTVPAKECGILSQESLDEALQLTVVLSHILELAELV